MMWNVRENFITTGGFSRVFFLLHLSEPEETTRHGELQFALQ